MTDNHALAAEIFAAVGLGKPEASDLAPIIAILDRASRPSLSPDGAAKLQRAGEAVERVLVQATNDTTVDEIEEPIRWLLKVSGETADALSRTPKAEPSEASSLRDSLQAFIFEITPRAHVVTPSKSQKITRRVTTEIAERLQAMLSADSLVTALSTAAPQAQSEPVSEWRCFHCNEVFTDEHDARLHFGGDDSLTACLIKGAEGGLVAALRRAENDTADAWFAIHNETTDAAKAYFAQNARHQEQLRAVEQVGYDRGIADAKAHPETLGLFASPQPQPVAIKGLDEPPEVTLLRGPLSKRATSADFNEWQAREVVAYIDRLRTAIATPSAQGDMVLVPREPTDAMIEAGIEALREHTQLVAIDRDPLFVWRYMLHAALATPQARPETNEQCGSKP